MPAQKGTGYVCKEQFPDRIFSYRPRTSKWGTLYFQSVGLGLSDGRSIGMGHTSFRIITSISAAEADLEA